MGLERAIRQLIQAGYVANSLISVYNDGNVRLHLYATKEENKQNMPVSIIVNNLSTLLNCWSADGHEQRTLF